MDELFAEAFRALIGVGGAGWLVSGIELLGLIYLFKENGRVRDRVEALSERTVVVIERVAASNQLVATGLESSTRSREDLTRLVAELARQLDSSSKRIIDEIVHVMGEVRVVEESTRGTADHFRRVYESQDRLSAVMQQYLLEIARVGAGPPLAASGQPLRLGSTG